MSFRSIEHILTEADDADTTIEIDELKRELLKHRHSHGQINFNYACERLKELKDSL